MQSKKSYSRLVVKVGSSLINYRDNAIDLSRLGGLIRQINRLWDQGKEVILVSSGAVACGMSVLKLKKRPKDIPGLQAAAAIGQNELMGLYRRLLSEDGRLCAQILLTWEDFEDRERYLNVRHTISHLLKNKVLAIINENDTVSTEEIRFGDNDRLSALVANLVGADLLVILSDVDGLYRLPQKEVISVVDKINPEIARLCCNTDKETCVGGMSSKIEAAKIAIGAGIPVIIASGASPDALLRAAGGEAVGTLFLPKADNLKAKERWIAYGVRPKGILIVDPGAKKALVENHKSLLSVGITAVKGNFKKDEMVSISDAQGEEFARGRVNFSAKEIEAQKGLSLKREVVHRDDLVVL